MAKVLIVDDNEDVREIVSEIVMSIGHEPLEASGGVEGLQMARDGSPDLVILDLNMPDMDGWTVLRKMKEESLTDSFKVMMLTATVDIGADIFGLQDVVHGYLRKPFDNKELAERLEEALEDRSETTVHEVTVDIRPGYGYIVEERKPETSMRHFVSTIQSGSEGLCVSRDHPKVIRKEHGLEAVPIIWLSNKLGKAYVNPANIGILRDTIVRFVENSGQSVIMINGIEFLMVNNDFTKVLRMIHQITEAVMERRSSLIVSVDPRALDTRELALLERNMEIIRVEDEAPVHYISLNNEDST